jgi:hypothetical protein
MLSPLIPRFALIPLPRAGAAGEPVRAAAP